MLSQLRSQLHRGFALRRSLILPTLLRRPMKTINPGITIVQRGTPVRHRSTGTTAVALNETSISLARPLDAPLAEDSPEFALRPYQSEALKACVLALDEGDERIGVGMPVGSGRTLVYSRLIPRLLSRGDTGGSILVLCDSVQRAKHAFTTLQKLCPGCTVELEQGASAASGCADVTVATCRSIGQEARLERYDCERFRAIIVDEAHLAATETYNKILSHFNSNLESPNRRTTTKNPPYSADVPIIGFSSTFSRHDNVPLSTFRKIVYHIDVLDLLVSEWTASVRFTTVKADLRLSNASVSRSTDDFDVTSLGEVMNTRGLNDLVLRVYGERATDRLSTLIFCVDLAHVAELMDTFQRAGIDARSVTGNTKRSEREMMEEEFKNGNFPVLISCEVYARSNVLPNVDCIIVARPTRSRNLFLRMIGQGLTQTPDRDFCRIIDLVDSVNKVDGLISIPGLFGLPEDAKIDDDTPQVLAALREYRSRGSLERPAKVHPEVHVDNVRYIEEEDLLQRVGDGWFACGSGRYVLLTGSTPFMAVVRHNGTYIVMESSCLPQSGESLSLRTRGVVAVTETLQEACRLAEIEAEF